MAAAEQTNSIRSYSWKWTVHNCLNRAILTDTSPQVGPNMAAEGFIFYPLLQMHHGGIRAYVHMNLSVPNGDKLRPFIMFEIVKNDGELHDGVFILRERKLHMYGYTQPRNLVDEMNTNGKSISIETMHDLKMANNEGDVTFRITLCLHHAGEHHQKVSDAEPNITPADIMAEHYDYLRRTGKHSDMIARVYPPASQKRTCSTSRSHYEDLKAHRMVLSVRTSVFRNMWPRFADKNIWHVHGATVDTVQVFLAFVYSAYLVIPSDRFGTLDGFTKLAKLMEMAHSYDIHELADEILKTIASVEWLTREVCVPALELGDYYGTKDCCVGGCEKLRTAVSDTLGAKRGEKPSEEEELPEGTTRITTSATTGALPA